MILQEQKFRYRKSYKIINWGCSFDSLTELKFAVSIRDEYEFLRSRVSIYYHPGTKKPTEYIRMCHHRYTPDFLIRHKETCKAFLVEIKPRAFENHPQLLLRKEVAENYIRWKNYDWEFKVVFDDEIFLDQEQWEEFQDCAKLKSKSAWKIWFEEYNKKFDRSAPSFLKTVPSDTNIRFVMFGNRAIRY
ncbi:MAG: TnsA endonuclease N-terminal domain-containing protein [Ginsengibacter sp.]